MELLPRPLPARYGNAPSYGNTPSVFGQRLVTDQTGMPSVSQQADAQRLFQPIFQPQPVKPPSPKPQPVYSDEVGNTSRTFMSFTQIFEDIFPEHVKHDTLATDSDFIFKG